MRAALEEAISEAGGTNALAASLGVSAQRLSNWLSRGAPAEFCPDIERVSGVLVERLRPDLRWIRIKGHPLLDVASVGRSISRNVNETTKRRNPRKGGMDANTGRKVAA